MDDEHVKHMKRCYELAISAGKKGYDTFGAVLVHNGKILVTAKNYEVVSFMLTCSEETLKKRHDRRGDQGETNYYWLHLPPCPGDVIVDTDKKSIWDIVRGMKKQIDSVSK